jgi:hypothetical protein
MTWTDRFIKRHQGDLITSWTTGLDKNRHNADSEDKYKHYFQLLHKKIKKYSVEPRHTYNMEWMRKASSLVSPGVRKGCLTGPLLIAAK